MRHGHSHSHSHDSADLVDDALDSDAAGRRALLISLVGLVLTAAVQTVVVVLSGSVALLGDTLHNIADALTAVPLLIAFRLARRPANARYTYGYGRAEDLAGLFVIAMITLSSVALLGAAGTGLGWRRADPIVGLLITVAILGVLRSAVRQVGAHDIAHHAEAHLLSDVRRLTAAAVHARPVGAHV
jgi:divalent metal cation (Fe/Co/Zn/Cd) transporter